MSITLDGLGLRMLAIRKREGFTQSVMAAKLDISDRAYNYYEQEKRELPISVATRFCNLFEISIEWLLVGDTGSIADTQLDIVAASVSAVLTENSKRGTNLSNDKLGQFVANVFDRCRDGTAVPSEVATKLFGLLP